MACGGGGASQASEVSIGMEGGESGGESGGEAAGGGGQAGVGAVPSGRIAGSTRTEVVLIRCAARRGCLPISCLHTIRSWIVEPGAGGGAAVFAARICIIRNRAAAIVSCEAPLTAVAAPASLSLLSR